MPPDSSLLDATPGSDPQHTDVQQLVEAESGHGAHGILRRWLASDAVRAAPTDAGRVVLTSTAAGVQISRDNGTTAPAQVIVDGTAAGGGLTGTYPSPSLSTATLDALIPPGTIWAYAATAPPPGWLACNGAQVSQAAYPKLYAVIGATYNTGGEAVGAFRLPNLAGRVVLGISGAHPLSEQGGAETGGAHTHTGSHSHGLNSHTHGIANHQHTPGAHRHDISGHSHPLTATHTHGPGAHTHDISGHTHVVNLDHDHGNALAAAGVSATTLNGRFTAGGANALPDAHTHPVDLPGLGLINTTSGGSLVSPNTGTPSAVDTGGVTGTPSSGLSSAADTGTPSAVDTGSGGTAATDGATGTTGTDSSAPAATYGSALANMMPFTALQFIVRTG